MKKRKVFAFLTVAAATAATIYAVNRFLEKTAIADDLLNDKNNRVFHWRFGEISYKKSGSGSPLLLLHELGPCSSSYEWNKVIDDLGKKHTVYSIDLPGCGLSEKQKITYTNFYYVEMITEFIKSVIGCPVILMATGLSASIAITSCNFNSELVRKLILINPSDMNQLNQVPSRKSKLAKAMLELPLIGTMIYNILVSRKNIENEFANRLFYDPENVTSMDIRVYRESAYKGNHGGKYLYSSIIGNYAYLNIGHALKNINKDIVLIAGAEQENIQDTLDTYTKINPAIETEFIPETRHLPHLECPDVFMEKVNVYL